MHLRVCAYDVSRNEVGYRFHRNYIAVGSVEVRQNVWVARQVRTENNWGRLDPIVHLDLSHSPHFTPTIIHPAPMAPFSADVRTSS
jgi:hypothetical protein